MAYDEAVADRARGDARAPRLADRAQDVRRDRLDDRRQHGLRGDRRRGDRAGRQGRLRRAPSPTRRRASSTSPGGPMRGFVCVSPARALRRAARVVDRRRLRLRRLAAREKPEVARAYDEAMAPRGQLTLFTIRGIRIGVDYLLVLRPLSDHPLALGLLPRRARRRAVRLRPVPARGRLGARLLRLDPAARARPRGGRQPPRDPDHRDHPVAVRRRRADEQGLRLARDRVQDRRRRAGGDPGARDRLLGGRDRGRRRRRVLGRDPARLRRRRSPGCWR